MRNTKIKTYTLIGTKDVFTISLIIAFLTIISVYFFGLGYHHTFFENTIISTTLLSLAFFLFITNGLYKGIKLKDELGRITDNIKVISLDNIPSSLPSADSIDIDAGEGCAGIIVGIILWILVAIAAIVLLWLFGNVVWITLVTFIAMLYWIFFRALRLVFRNARKTKGDLMESVKFGFLYTCLYTSWIYGIIILTEYVKK